MQLNEISEVYYITNVKHIPSILEHGILSHNRAHGKGFVQDDFSMDSVQKIRSRKIVPLDKRTIHDHVNLYIQPQNATLFKIKDREGLCIMRIKPTILKEKDVVVVDRNAASRDAKFYPALEGIKKVSREVLTASGWNNSQLSKEENERNKSLRCAEVLIPDRLHPSYIGGLFVPASDMKEKLGALPFPVDVAPERFFRSKTASKVSQLANSRFQNPINYAGPPSPKRVAVAKGQSTLSGFFTRAVSSSSSSSLSSSSSSSSSSSQVVVKSGSLFDSTCKTHVNTVNCKGVMGKGIAKEFKERHPEMFADYKKKCDSGEVALGMPYHYKSGDVSIINFPTKNHWENKSNIEDIKRGLDYFVAHAKEWGIESVAFPPLGCGNGGLNFDEVRPIMIEKLSKLGIRVEIYR